MKPLGSNFLKRRLALCGLFLISVNTAIAKVFLTAGHDKTPPQGEGSDFFNGSDQRFKFIHSSNDLKNYLRQIEHDKTEYFAAIQARYPEIGPVVKERFGDEFWNRYTENVISAIYKDTVKLLSEEEAQKITEFFNTPAGLKYLQWKNIIQSRDSELYGAIKRMSDERGRFTRKAVDDLEAKKKA